MEQLINRVGRWFHSTAGPVCLHNAHDFAPSCSVESIYGCLWLTVREIFYLQLIHHS